MTWHATSLNATDQHSIPVFSWDPPSNPKGVIQITHGMAEHSQRYAALAAELQGAGFVVITHDHRGHGLAAQPQGHFCDSDGWERVCDDLRQVHQWAQRQFPDLPLILLGHSMGSYISLGYLMRNPLPLAGCVLSGSNYGSPALYRLARMIARIERWRLGPSAPSKVMDRLGFGAFNRAFKPNRTEFDWLSRDPDQVDRYIADPLCGFPCSAQLWIDMLGGLLEITDPAQLANVPNIPLHVIGGSRDPVSAPNGLPDLFKALNSDQRDRVSLKLYEEARHELLNESNRDEVINELLQWIGTTLEDSKQASTPST
ncbi:lysophospholipase [Aestuariirhabdus sp. Z084]|uniref:alpha/beta hydrolase n=1 Tax=Aestuariirhabdus haliotis TaxID=2918751 RepID=UPI00201B37CC|nr:alpha/beta hydrolase [Aestuariirhabdus haliotis]MCL6414630.1 lysophospholipase [Aestuariirhabdus haliotis]MCL6418388.1 lysophospholipase [Aestuariirhabdus haliotis]